MQTTTSRNDLTLCVLCSAECSRKSLPLHLKTCMRQHLQQQQQQLQQSTLQDTIPSRPHLSHLSQSLHYAAQPSLLKSTPLQQVVEPSTVTLACPNCRRHFSQDKMHNHLRTCQGRSSAPKTSIKEDTGNEESTEKVSKVPSPLREDVRNPDVSMVNEYVNESNEVVLKTCPSCSRHFSQDSYSRHIKVCQARAKPRRPFDVVRSRVQGTELEKYVLGPLKKPAQEEKEKPIVKRSNWRHQHEQLLRMLRANRPSQDGTTTSNEVAVSDPHPDYVECDACHRRFAPMTAERHIPHCRESKKRESLKKGGKSTIPPASVPLSQKVQQPPSRKKW